jgi:hypothetical protein
MAKETVFSSIKRTYGEYVSATKLQNMVQEIIMKISLYNLFKKKNGINLIKIIL